MTTAFSIDTAAALDGPDWLVARRRAAAERFTDATLPTTEEEVWRYSRIGDLDLGAYAPAPGDGSSPVVTVEGDAEVQSGSSLVAGGPLGSVLGDGSDALGLLHDAFAAPVVIQVPDGVDAGTITVVHAAPANGIATFPRLVVALGAQSRARVVEVFSGADGIRSLSLPVTELLVGRDATLHHASLQLLGDASWQLARLTSTVDTGGTLHAGTAAFGGDYARLRVDTTLAGRGAHGEITAAYFGDGSQLLDFRTFQDHAAPDTTSNLLFKGALAEKSASVYTGLIKIRPTARGSQAFQTNRNLKLSDDAWAESVPNLEIENNEVQCSHASTVGPVDPEQRFYLESRGVPTARADRLIVRGFFEEVLAGLDIGEYDATVRGTLDRSLERGLA